MKIIFLDNDGVICLSNNWGSRYKKQTNWGGRKMSMSFKDVPVEHRFDNFDNKAIKVLNEILKETDAEIVVSSDWRHNATLEELQKYYLSQGIIKPPISVTRLINDVDPSLWKLVRFSAELEIERSIEILDWLQSHPEVTNWVAVDDLNMSIDFLSEKSLDKLPKLGLKNFVHTPKSNEGIKQSGIKEKIISFLNEKPS